jgi:replicative DNA helicase
MEAAVLGAMLIERDCQRDALTLLRSNADIFYHPAHQHIFRAIVALNQRSEAVDNLTLVHELRSRDQLDKVGGMGFVAGLTMHINSAAHIQTHCTKLIELYAKRCLLRVGRLFTAEASSHTSDALDLLAEAQRQLNQLHNTLQIRQARTLGAMYHQAIDEIVAATRAPAGLTGVTSGLTALDNVTGGWQPSDLILIAGRPGMGKTSFTMACACQAEAAGQHGAFYSLEMGAMQLTKKAIATEGGYSTSQLVRGVDMSPDEAEALRERAAVLARSGLLVDDTPAISVAELRAKVAQAVAEHGVRIVYVDYLQLMTGDKTGNREQEIGSISRGLKLIAKEHNIPIIALAQLSRAVEARGGDKRPQLSDLRESGSLEQDADLVIFLYRPEYYKILEDDMGNSTVGLTEVIIAKHRNGALKNPVVQSDMRTGRYSDLETDRPHEVATSPAGFPSVTSDFDNDSNPAF